MIDAHRGAFEYDWRTRFGKSLRAIGRSMTWGEAVRMLAILARDTSSQVSTALAGWQFPASREALALMDVYDATTAAHFKNPKPYPRPWDAPPKRFGSAVGDIATVLATHRAAIDAARGVKADAKGRLHDARGRFVAKTPTEGGVTHG